MDIKQTAIELTRREKQEWEDATAFVTDRVAFQMRNLIKVLRKNYWGIFDTPNDPITGRKKIWIPLTEVMVENVVKNIDLDQKDINFRAKNKRGQAFTEVTRFLAKHQLDKIFFGEILDMAERQLAIDGTVVWKTTGSKETPLRVEQVDLLNFYIDPTAKSIQDTGAVIERAILTVDQFMSMDGWHDKDNAKLRFDVDKNDPDNLSVTGTTGRTPLVEVFERWGQMPKSLITGKFEDKDTYIEGHIVISNIGDQPVVHLIEENKGLKPYEEAWYTRVSGRWYGKGVAEKVMMLQLWDNTVVNIRINRSYVSQLGLFKIKKGAGVTPQMISRLSSNGAITVNKMDDVEQFVMQEASQASYKDEEIIQGWAERITSAFESVTGESLPASTPATNAILQNRSAKSEFQKIKEGIGMFLQRWMDRHALALIVKGVKPSDIIRITGDDDKYKNIVERVVAYQASQILDEMFDEGITVPPQEIQRAIQNAETRLRSNPELFVETMESIEADMMDTKVFVTNEEIDVAVTVDRLVSTLSLAPEFREDIIRQVFDLLGLPMPENKGLPQEPQQEQPQPQGQPAQGLQQLTTQANVPQLG